MRLISLWILTLALCLGPGTASASDFSVQLGLGFNFFPSYNPPPVIEEHTIVTPLTPAEVYEYYTYTDPCPAIIWGPTLRFYSGTRYYSSGYVHTYSYYYRPVYPSVFTRIYFSPPVHGLSLRMHYGSRHVRPVYGPYHAPPGLVFNAPIHRRSPICYGWSWGHFFRYPDYYAPPVHRYGSLDPRPWRHGGTWPRYMTGSRYDPDPYRPYSPLDYQRSPRRSTPGRTGEVITEQRRTIERLDDRDLRRFVRNRPSAQPKIEPRRHLTVTPDSADAESRSIRESSRTGTSVRQRVGTSSRTFSPPDAAGSPRRIDSTGDVRSRRFDRMNLERGRPERPKIQSREPGITPALQRRSLLQPSSRMFGTTPRASGQTGDARSAVERLRGRSLFKPEADRRTLRPNPMQRRTIERSAPSMQRSGPKINNSPRIQSNSPRRSSLPSRRNPIEGRSRRIVPRR